VYVDAFKNVASEAIGEHLGDRDFDLGLKFESMSSPKYYNFETDRVYAHMPRETVDKLFAISFAEGHTTLAKVLKDRHTSCSGFHSWYTNELQEWLAKPLEDWDHNELCSLLLAAGQIADPHGDAKESLIYAVLGGDGLYSEWSEAVNWVKFEAKVADKREEKREQFAADHPGEAVPEPEPRCQHTADLFRTASK
jgi:hypothetical protein